ncbi:MAG: hypothetical protein WHU10_02120 [Fimbriimonadales bacterium]
MNRLFRMLRLLSVLCLLTAFAKAERYGVFEFTPPPGERGEAPEAVSYSEPIGKGSRLILLGRPSPHEGAGHLAFVWEWRRWMFERDFPSPEVRQLPDGWTEFHSTKTTESSKRSLFVYVGHGKRASVVVDSAGQEAMDRHAEAIEIATAKLRLVPPSPKPLPAGCSIGEPKGFVREGPWLVRKEPAKSGSADDQVEVRVRVLDPIEAKDADGNAHSESDLLFFLVLTAVHPIGADMGDVVFQRWIGDKVPAWFVPVEARISGATIGDEAPLQVSSVFLIPAGDVWIPIVAHQLYRPWLSRDVGPELDAQTRQSLEQSSALLEEFLASVRLNGKGANLVEADWIVGDWKAEDGEKLQVNDFRTGGRAIFETGSSLQLAKGGGFSGTLSGRKMQGKFRVEGDRLILSPSAGSEVVYRIAAFKEEIRGRKALLLVPADRYKAVNAQSISGKGTLLLTTEGS